MGRGRTRTLRLGLAVALVTVLAAVVATAAYALAFDDGAPCPVGGEQVFTCPSGTVDAQYSVQLKGRGGCEPAHSYSVVNGALPAGLTMSSSGRISGTPTSAGTSRFWVVLADIPPSAGGPVWCTNPLTAEREFAITVNPRVLVTTESTPPGTVGASYSLVLSAAMKSGPSTTSPPSSPLAWTLVQGTLPAGLSLDSAMGVIAGTPTAEGASSFVVRAALPDGRADTKALTITVRQPLAIKTAKPFVPDRIASVWEVGVPFSSKLLPSGGSGTYTWTLAEGALPTGLALATDGTISGTPTAGGAFRATVRLADSEGRTLDAAATFAVAKRLTVSTLLLRPGKVGRLYKAKLNTTGGIPPKTWKVASGPLPKGIRLDRTLGVLAGIPTKPGLYRVTFEAKDGLKVTAQKTLRVVVAP